MAVKINVQANTVKIDSKFKSVINKFPTATRRSLAKASALGRQIIDQRTRKGQKLGGGRFIKYSESYKQSDAFKRKKNKFVDLVLDGLMLSAMSFRVRGSTGEIFFLRAAESEKAFRHHTGEGKLPRRPFFGIAKTEERRLFNVFEKTFSKEARIR